MDALKKFVAERRSHFSSTPIWQKGDDTDDMFCYHQERDDDGCDWWAPNASAGTGSKPAVPYYGFQRRPPQEVPSSEFDNDQRFRATAKALLHRFDVENASARDAIRSTLCTADEQRLFLDTIDARYSVACHDTGDPMKHRAPSDELTEVVLRTRSIFYSTLQCMRKEAAEGYTNSCQNDSRLVPAGADPIRQGLYQEELRAAPPIRPKQFGLSSPIECTPRATSLLSVYDNHPHLLHQESRKRCKWFFEDPTERVRKSIGVMVSSSSSSSSGNPFASLKGPSRFHFDFKLPLPPSSSAGTPVRTLQLDDDRAVMGRSSMYRPPTSPISRVFTDRIGK